MEAIVRSQLSLQLAAEKVRIRCLKIQDPVVPEVVGHKMEEVVEVAPERLARVVRVARGVHQTRTVQAEAEVQAEAGAEAHLRRGVTVETARRVRLVVRP